MANVRGGVFTLRTLSRLKKDENWFALSDVWIAPAPFTATPPNTGYFGGGHQTNSANMFSTVDKIDYSSDTRTPTPALSLSSARYGSGATGSSTAGYFGGGGYPLVATMDKITYSSDTRTLAPGANLNVVNYFLAATGNSTNGYFGGGDTGGPTFSTMDKIQYSTDTRLAAVPGAFLSLARAYLAATGNSTAGYFGGGFNHPSTNRTTMDKLTYSTDITLALPATGALSAARNNLAATGNSTAGYFGGGPGLSTMDKITYSSDTRAVLPATGALSSARYGLGASGNSTNGYFGGGREGGSVSTMDKIDYATDTRLPAIPGANLSLARRYLAASSARANALPNTPYLSPAPSGLPVRYSDGVPGSPPASTPTPSTYLGPVPASNTAYFGGGSAGGALSTVERIDFSSDTRLATPGVNLTTGRFGLTATGNSSFGYFGGGNTPGGARSTMDRITYSTNNPALVPGASLSSARYGSRATGNSTNGYFGGGFPHVSTMDKIEYSTDTRLAAVPAANLSAARGYAGATSSSTAGYFGGGLAGPAPFASNSKTTMDKLIYSTDTTSQAPGASITSIKYGYGSAGNSTAGYFGGGILIGSPGGLITIDKLTYSTDTTSTIPASLSVGRYSLTATGNSTAGYFAGGSTAGDFNSTMDKLTYSTDTLAPVPGARLSNLANNSSATSALINALPGLAQGPVPYIV